MKKTNKRLLAAAGIFCAVGILFFGVGIASGGRNYVKTADLNRISGTAMMDSSDSHAILSKTKIDAFSSLNIDLKNIDLDIKASDDDTFYISYNIETNDGMLPLSYQVQNNALNIVEKKGHESYSYIHIDINFLQEMLGQSHVIENSNKVTVYIPKKTDLSGFSCKMGYGDISVESLNAQKAVIQNEDGDINISDSNFKNLELSADLGDLKINDTILTDGQIEMMDGDVKAENISFSGENEFTSDLGDITLSIPKKTLSTLSIEAEASEINIPEELGNVMTDEDDNQLVSSENKTQNSLQIKNKTAISKSPRIRNNVFIYSGIKTPCTLSHHRIQGVIISEFLSGNFTKCLTGSVIFFFYFHKKIFIAIHASGTEQFCQILT